MYIDTTCSNHANSE